MDGWGGGVSIGSLVGNGCLCCWWGECWVGGLTGGSVGVNVSVAPCLRLYWCNLLWMWDVSRGNLISSRIMQDERSINMNHNIVL